MHFNILTIFPEMFPGTLGAGVVGRALERGIWSYDVINIRDFAYNNYGSVDDEQFGGGAGMVMRPDVLGADEYYQADLIGSDVVRDGEKIGRVVCFQNFGAGDIMELDNGNMVSFIGANVDIDAHMIYVR